MNRGLQYRTETNICRERVGFMVANSELVTRLDTAVKFAPAFGTGLPL